MPIAVPESFGQCFIDWFPDQSPEKWIVGKCQKYLGYHKLKKREML